MINTQTKKVLAIDPGFERLGVCVLEKKQNNIDILFSECFKTNPKDEFAKRLFEIIDHLDIVIKKHKPQDLAIETLFINKNQKTAMRVSETRGAILYLAYKNNLKIKEYSPLQIKSSITGSGASDKNSVQKMLFLLLPILKKDIKKIDDEYDAIACGLTHFALDKGL